MNKELRIKFIALIFFLTSCFMLYVSSINAQQVSLSITPPLLELVIKPGKSIMVAYRVENHGDPVMLTTRVVNFEPKDNLGNIRLKDDLRGPMRFSLDNSEIQLERPFFLKTGESQQLLLRIRAPEGATSGDYYYTLLAETTPTNNPDRLTGTKTKASIGSNILVTITNSGIIEVKPKVVLFEILNKKKFLGKKINLFDSFDKIPLVFILENKGKNLIKPEGKITLTGNFSEKIEYDIIPKNILAESQRLVEAVPAGNQATSSSQLNTNHSSPVTLTISGFFIGLYRLSSQVSFGENSPTVFANTSFYAFPFKLLGGLILIIILIIFIIKRFSQNEAED